MVVLDREVQAALVGVHSLIERDLGLLWAALDLGNPELARDMLIEHVPRLVAAYGDVAATVAADWYDELRAQEVAVGRFRAQLASGVPTEWVQERVKFGVAPLWTPNPDQALLFITNATKGYVTQQLGNTVAGSIKADPQGVGWQRIPNSGACKFCLMLADRGGVYKKGTARFSAHAGCMCSARPSWDQNAREVSVNAYIASERTSGMSAAQKAEHNALIREWIAANL